MSKIVPKTLPAFYILLCFLIIQCLSCKEPTDGCLDIDAVNYDVSADDPCPDDCCTFPVLSLEVAHRFDTLIFNYDSIYTVDLGPRVKVEEVIFFLSNFRLTSLGGDSLEVRETIVLDIINADTQSFKDDYTLVSRNFPSFNYDVGEIRGEGSFTNVKFDVGLRGNAAFSNAETIAEDHALGLGTDTLWTVDQGYVFNRIEVDPDTSIIDNNRLFEVNQLVEVVLTFPIEVDRGFDVSIPIKVDYKTWFSGIDFVNNPDDNDILEKIVQNTANAFSINQ